MQSLKFKCSSCFFSCEIPSDRRIDFIICSDCGVIYGKQQGIFEAIPYANEADLFKDYPSLKSHLARTRQIIYNKIKCN